MKCFPFLLLGLGICFPGSGEALILSGGTGAFNTTDPNPGSPLSGWNHVAWSGDDSQASAVYLGYGWAISAGHVGARTISFAGDPDSGAVPAYTVVPGSAVPLTNVGAPGQSTNTDLVVFQINGDPGLPALAISAVSPSGGTALTHIATGRDRVAALSVWDVDISSNPYAWTLNPASPDPEATGYLWDSIRTKRWGTNNIIGPSEFENLGTVADPVNVLAFASNFSETGGNESQASGGDSGSGVFVLNGGNWELAGIALAVGEFNGQPDNTAVFGNETYYADLSFYRSQIMSIIPEPGSAALSAMALLGLLRRRRA